jgi:hypothetical protein
MAKQDLDRDIRDRIDGFVAELSALVKAAALESVRSALGETARRGPGRPRKIGGAAKTVRGRRRRGGKRDSKAIDALTSRLLSHIKSKPGQRLEQISAALGTPTRDLKLPASKLLAAKAVRTSGQRRGTKYHPR